MAAGGTDRSTYSSARRLFAVGLGAIFVAAFASFGVQALGLIGARGIAPVAELLEHARTAFGDGALTKLPTLFWLQASDPAIIAVCVAGCVTGAVMVAGFCPGACAVVSWALYLSLCSVSSPFLDFQWDALLLETGLVGALMLPWKWRPDWADETPRQQVGRWLVWWLLFRLMFESGLVKLTWGDATWLELRALDFHFETQPLPTPTAWYAHQLPRFVLRAATVLTFLLEMGVPFLLLAPRRWRRAGALSMIILQFGILLTGNYAFFNWLTIALCLTLFDDRTSAMRRLATAPLSSDPQTRIRWAVAGAAGAFFFAATAPSLVESFRVSSPDPLGCLLGPTRSFNSYGLFRVMTTERPEIIVEGSRDGSEWKAYEFRWKPGDLIRMPPIIAPHQPRLDWQMWFAALGDVRGNDWLVSFLVRLLQGSPEVVALLGANPFPGAPPRFVRAILYDYHFTAIGSRDGWWRREKKGTYCPPISLRGSE